MDTIKLRVGTDYDLTPQDADTLLGITGLPAEYRAKLLRLIVRDRGTEGLVRLFSEFIGLANSVVANNRMMVEMFMAAEGVVHPESVHKINLPTIRGALYGVNNERIPNDKMCESCAFRHGTPPNQCEGTALDASDSADGEYKFMCHKDPALADISIHNQSEREVKAARVCGGYAAARKEIKQRELTCSFCQGIVRPLGVRRNPETDCSRQRHKNMGIPQMPAMP